MSEKICNCNCDQKSIAMMPVAVYEASEERHARHYKGLLAVIILLVVLLVGSNIAWLIYESQFETVEESYVVEQDNEGGYNNYIGNDGDITNGKTDN